MLRGSRRRAVFGIPHTPSSARVVEPHAALGLLVSSASDAIDDKFWGGDLLTMEAPEFPSGAGFEASLALATLEQLPESLSPTANQQQPSSPASAFTVPPFGMQPPDTPLTPRQTTGGVEPTFEEDNLQAAV